ncbi:MAG: AmmeMemoRadiSam system protein A [Candidatus Margulisbacteria bacterium]|nr:AmmeMemoRadiSam system protein A [Candidatus Margulisiibacteriota bacterium]
MSEHPLVRLARKTIETYVKDGKIIEPPKELSPEMKEKAGVFVSLHREGELRGCIGTFAPTAENVAQEIIRNAIESATRDPRFPPMTEDELSGLEISVDVLSRPEPAASKAELDPSCYGCIVKSGARRGLLLPDLPGVNTADDQIAICKRKAGIPEHETVELFKFKVRRYH